MNLNLCVPGLQLVNKKVVETNSFYNPEMCNNGGGYSQPATDALLRSDMGVSAIISACDLSCGDFGSRSGGEIEIVEDDIVMAEIAYSVDYRDMDTDGLTPYGWLVFNIREGASIIIEELIATLEKAGVSTDALEEAVSKGNHILEGRGEISFYVEDSETVPEGEEETEEIDFHLFRKRNRRKITVPVV